MTDEIPEIQALTTDNVGARIKHLLELRKIAEREKADGDRAVSAAKVRIGDINDELRQIVDLPDERRAQSAGQAMTGFSQGGQAYASNPLSQALAAQSLRKGGY